MKGLTTSQLIEALKLAPPRALVKILTPKGEETLINQAYLSWDGKSVTLFFDEGVGE